jgi:hypothetical protein
MTKVTHTPGPWTYQYSPYTAQDGREIPAFEVHGDDVKVCDTNEDRPVAEQEANARLIADAPELLGLIKQIARMTMDGEPVDDGNGAWYDFVMENDDAVSTLNRLIEDARCLEARAEGEAAESKAISLPPDPEGKNGDRAEWAAAAIRHFQCITGTDWEDAVADLLCDLMHFCDRQNFNFGKELDRARMNYKAETMEGGAA